MKIWRKKIKLGYIISGLFVVGLLWVGYQALQAAAYAENISYESSLVWRMDGAGDYRLPNILGNNTYTVTPSVATKGVIKSITATWVFDGAVSMEVSADNGLHFTPIVNGVPLEDGFTPGTVLKWRAHVAEDSSLKEVKITYKDSSKTTAGFDDPALASFRYRKSFRVDGSAENMLYNYQLKISVAESIVREGADIACEGHLQNDFNDIRFTLNDGVTSLPYFLEKIEGDAPNRVAHFFVKVPQIPKGGITLFIYYGKPQEKSLSDSETVFDFYEYFSKDSLNTDKWASLIAPGGSLSVSDNGLVLEGASVASKSFQLRDGLIEFSATALRGPEIRLVFHGKDSNLESDLAQAAFSSNYEGAQHCLAVGSVVKVNDEKPIQIDTAYDYRVIVDGTRLVFERFSQGYIQADQMQARVVYVDEEGAARKGFIGFKTGGSGNNKNITEFHWIRVRRYAAVEPYVDAKSVSQENDITLCASKNLVLEPNGNLALLKGVTEGHYLLPDTELSYDARIFLTSLKGEGVVFDLSTDAGESYKSNVKSDIYYYAAKKDFIAGRNLRERMRFLASPTGSRSPSLSSIALQYAAGAISVLSPNGAEILKAGTQKEIKWSAWDYERTYPMKIEYSLDRGENWNLIASQAENSGRYIWSIPAKLHLVGGISRAGMVRVCDGVDASVCDESDKPFTIVTERR